MAKDFKTSDKAVLFNGKALPGSDPETFTVVDEAYLKVPYFPHYFAVDKNQLYADATSKEGIQIWKDIDIESIEFFSEPLNNMFFADKNHFFRFNSHFIEYVTPNVNCGDYGFDKYITTLKNRKPNTDSWWNRSEEFYQSLKPISDFFYTDGKNVFYYFDINKVKPNGVLHYSYPQSFGLTNDQSYFSILPNVNPDTFKALNEYYSKANGKIYHINRAIEADAQSFEIIQGHFAKDKSGIYYNGYAVKENIDLQSFSIIETPETGPFSFVHFAKDKSKVFSTQLNSRIGKYEGYSELLIELDNSDANSFTYYNEKWAKDDNNVYCYGKIWKEIDAKTFKFLFTDAKDGNRSYVVDKNNLYDANGRKTIKAIDGASFEMLNEYWGKDKQSVFNFKTERIIKDLDPSTFKVTGNNGEAEDKNYSLRFVTILHNGKDIGLTELKKTKKKK